MDKKDKNPIAEIRARIDRIDDEIVTLLKRRVRYARQLRELKARNGMAVFDPVREKEIIERVKKRVPEELDRGAVANVFREIISMTRSMEEKHQVCFLGPLGTFSHQAAVEFFGRSVELVPVRDVDDVFQWVETGMADYGVVPVENSIQGTVGHTLDRLIITSLHIVGEIMLYISHSLLSHAPLKEIKTIYSHPQAFAQCKNWIRENLPRAKSLEVESTARAVQLASEDKDAAAVGSRLAGEIYNVPVVADNISDRKNNYTRFIVLHKSPLKHIAGKVKTSLIFAVAHRPGSLFRALEGFAKEGINLTKIESRPMKDSPWEYVFFVDFEGARTNPRVRRALKNLSESSTFVKTLGTYPVASAG